MSGQYTKLFRAITTSTVWMQPDPVRLVWITMLAQKDKDGVVLASLPGLAHIARVSLDDAVAAIEYLSAPDVYSRTKDHDGRRIEEIDGGWRVLNHFKYRDAIDRDDRKEYERTRKAAQRRRKQQKVSDSPGQSGTVTDISTHTDTDTEKNTTARKRAYPIEFERAWKAYPDRSGGNPKGRALKSWNARIREGIEPKELYAGVLRYAEFCDATGKLGTEYVQQAATFFAKDGGYTEAWEKPKAARQSGAPTWL